MRKKLRLLDLCCGAGGSAVGYHRAGFDEIVGVDSAPMPNYPFEFIQGNALHYLIDVIEAGGAGFDAIHTSWPCQASTALNRGTNRWTKLPNHVDLNPAGRELLKLTGLPFVMENVQGSVLRKDLVLCGEMFGLGVIRHRYFEVHGFDVVQPAHIPHRGRVAGMRHGEWFTGPYFAVYGDGGGKGTVAQWQEAMGIHHTNVRKEIAEAVPPAYTEYLGAQLMSAVLERAA